MIFYTHKVYKEHKQKNENINLYIDKNSLSNFAYISSVFVTKKLKTHTHFSLQLQLSIENQKECICLHYKLYPAKPNQPSGQEKPLSQRKTLPRTARKCLCPFTLVLDQTNPVPGYFLLVRIRVELLPTDVAIDVADNHLESRAYIGRIKS